MDLMQLQNAISGLGDDQIGKAMSMGGDERQVPHLMLMMEMAKRNRIRQNTPTQPPPTSTMYDEMRMGMYQPVPEPRFQWPEMPGQGQVYMGQSQEQEPQNIDPTTPSGLGALFSQN
jgi:hypothetical protein